jgi:hypothetical protein
MAGMCREEINVNVRYSRCVGTMGACSRRGFWYGMVWYGGITNGDEEGGWYGMVVPRKRVMVVPPYQYGMVPYHTTLPYPTTMVATVL